jgi:AsmA protein
MIFMKKLRVIFGVTGGIVLLGVIGIWMLANPNRYRDSIQGQVEKQLGRKVTLGEMSLGLFPLRFQVVNPVIAEDARIHQEPPFVRAEKLDIRIGLLPLIRGNVQVDSLELYRPSVELVRTAQGTWNFSSIGTAAATTTSAGGSASTPGFSLQRLAIRDGQIGVTDLQQKGTRTRYDHIDLTILNYFADRPFSFDVAAQIPGEAVQLIRLKGMAGPVAGKNIADTPFRGTLNLDRVSIESLMSFLDSEALPNVKGKLSGQSDVTSEAGTVASNGILKIEEAKINGLDIGYGIGFDYKLTARIADGLVNIETATLQLGAAPLSVTGSINTANNSADVDLKVKTGDVSIAEIARLASAFGVAFAPGTNVNGRVAADVSAKGRATRPAMTGSIAGRDLQISGKNIPQTIQVKAIDLTLSPTAVRSNEFDATTGKTTVSSQFALLQYASTAPSIEMRLRAPSATLPEIQSIARAYGITGLDQISGAGALNFDLHATGPLETLNTTAATRALNGTINLDFSPLKIAGFDTVHELGKIGGFANGLSQQNSTDIVRLIGKIVVKNGIAQTDDLHAQLGVGTLAAAGTADLASQALNLKLSAVFSKDFSDKAGIGRSGGFLNAAFANNDGEIVLPAIVTGTFAQPKFAPDLKAVVELQKQKLIGGKNITGAVANALGALTNNKQNDSQDDKQPAEKKSSGLRGLLDRLGGKNNSK